MRSTECPSSYYFKPRWAGTRSTKNSHHPLCPLSPTETCVHVPLTTLLDFYLPLTSSMEIDGNKFVITAIITKRWEQIGNGSGIIPRILGQTGPKMSSINTEYLHPINAYKPLQSPLCSVLQLVLYSKPSEDIMYAGNKLQEEQFLTQSRQRTEYFMI